MNLYNRFNEFLKNKLGKRTLKICLDGGFTCPNRDGTKARGGCIFCGEEGSGENIKSKGTVTKQIEDYFNSYRSQRAEQFIAYFQNFSSTYAPIDVLKSKYDEALIDKRIVALDIDTRCDLINEEVCKLLSSYKTRCYVYVELGLQTSNEKSHIFNNQQITNKDFEEAMFLLNKYEIDVVVHIMIGLPNETHQDIINTVNYLNRFNYQGLKIHSLYIIKNTFLCELYSIGKYIPLEMNNYIDETIYILTHINPNVIIHRITGDAPKDKLVAPEWNLHKKRVIIDLEKKMKENSLYQGKYYQLSNR